MQQKEIEQQTMFNPWSSVIGGLSKRYFKHQHEMFVNHINSKKVLGCYNCGALEGTNEGGLSEAGQKAADNHMSNIVVRFYKPDTSRTLCGRCTEMSNKQRQSQDRSPSPNDPADGARRSSM